MLASRRLVESVAYVSFRMDISKLEQNTSDLV